MSCLIREGPFSIFPKVFKVPTAQVKQRKWSKQFPSCKNTGNLEMLSKYRENKEKVVCSSEF